MLFNGAQPEPNQTNRLRFFSVGKAKRSKLGVGFSEGYVCADTCVFHLFNV